MHAPWMATHPEWIWELRTAARLLTVGSGFLLAGSLLFRIALIVDVFGVFTPLAALLVAFSFIALTVIGVLVYAFAWVALNEGSKTAEGMRVAFASSIVVLALSVMFHLLAVPRNPGYFLLFGGWVFVPYVPFVFGPVAIVHGVLFLLGTNFVWDPEADGLVVAGAIGLFAVAAVASLLQIVLHLELWLDGASYGWGLTFAGLTAAAYGAIAWGLAREYESRRTPLGRNWYRA